MVCSLLRRGNKTKLIEISFDLFLGHLNMHEIAKMNVHE